MAELHLKTWHFRAKVIDTQRRFIKEKNYLGVATTQYINHDLHDSFMHAQRSHQVRVLIENFVTHDISAKDEKLLTLRFR